MEFRPKKKKGEGRTWNVFRRRLRRDRERTGKMQGRRKRAKVGPGGRKRSVIADLSSETDDQNYSLRDDTRIQASLLLSSPCQDLEHYSFQAV